MSKASDWTIAPACKDPALQGEFQSHTVSWEFPTKEEAAKYAVFVETVHGKVQDDPNKLLSVMTEASMRLALALGNARACLKALASDVPVLSPLIVLALEKCDPSKVKL